MYLWRCIIHTFLVTAADLGKMQSDLGLFTFTPRHSVVLLAAAKPHPYCAFAVERESRPTARSRMGRSQGGPLRADSSHLGQEKGGISAVLMSQCGGDTSMALMEKALSDNAGRTRVGKRPARFRAAAAPSNPQDTTEQPMVSRISREHATGAVREFPNLTLVEAAKDEAESFDCAKEVSRKTIQSECHIINLTAEGPSTTLWTQINAVVGTEEIPGSRGAASPQQRVENLLGQESETALVLANYELVSSLDNDLALLGVLERLPQLRVVLIGRAFGILDGPLSAARTAVAAPRKPHRRPPLGDSAPAAMLARMLAQQKYTDAENLIDASFATYSGLAKEGLELLKQIPEHEITEHPALLSLRLVLEELEPTVPRKQVLRIAAQLRTALWRQIMEDSGVPTVRQLTHLIRAELALGMADQALAHATDLESLVHHEARASKVDGRSGHANSLATVAEAALLSGDMVLAKRSAQRALEVSTFEKDIFERIRALGLRAYLHADSSEFEAAAEDLLQITLLLESAGGDTPSLSSLPIQLSQALVSAHQGHLEEAVSALDSVQQHRLHGATWVYFVIAQAAVNLRVKGAIAAYDLMASRLAHPPHEVWISPTLSSRLSAVEASLAMRSDLVDVARRLLSGPLVPTPSIRLAKARLLLLATDARRARALLTELLQQPLPSNERAEALLLAAAAAHALGDTGEAATYISLASRLEPWASSDILSSVPYTLLSEMAAAEREVPQEFAEIVRDIPEHLRVEQHEALSDLEAQTLQAVADSASLSAASEALGGLSLNTIKFRLKNIYMKLRVSRKQDAISRAQRLGFLRAPGDKVERRDHGPE